MNYQFCFFLAAPGLLTLVTHTRIDNPSSSESLTFDILEDLYLSTSLIAYTGEEVNLTVSGTVTLASASDAPTPSPSDNQNTAATQRLSWPLWVGSAIAVVVGML